MELRDCKWNPEGEETHKNITSNSPAQSSFFFFCLCLLFCLFSFLLLISGSSHPIIEGKCSGSSSSSTGACHHPLQEREALVKRKRMMVGRGREAAVELMRRRPGSYPPRCRYKCGNCTPCRAVHVPVPPGRAVIAEYYPEAWRCKCRNRLYLP